MFLPAVGLNHVSGRGKGHGYGCKAGFDRQSNDTGHRCDESASILQKVFFMFLFLFLREYGLEAEEKVEHAAVGIDFLVEGEGIGAGGGGKAIELELFAIGIIGVGDGHRGVDLGG